MKETIINENTYGWPRQNLSLPLISSNNQIIFVLGNYKIYSLSPVICLSSINRIRQNETDSGMCL